MQVTTCFCEQRAAQEGTDSFVPVSYCVTRYNGSKLKLLLLLPTLKKKIFDCEQKSRVRIGKNLTFAPLMFTTICTLFVESRRFIFSKFMDSEQLLPVSKSVLRRSPHSNRNTSILDVRPGSCFTCFCSKALRTPTLYSDVCSVHSRAQRNVRG